MSEKIKFDSLNESQSFSVGSDNIFFRRTNDGRVVVMHAEDGCSYPSSVYMYFNDVGEAEAFLKKMLSEQ